MFLPVVLEVPAVQEDPVHSLLPQHLHLATHVDLVVPEDHECQADHLHHVHPSVQPNQALPGVTKKQQIWCNQDITSIQELRILINVAV